MASSFIVLGSFQRTHSSLSLFSAASIHPRVHLSLKKVITTSIISFSLDRLLMSYICFQGTFTQRVSNSTFCSRLVLDVLLRYTQPDMDSSTYQWVGGDQVSHYLFNAYLYQCQNPCQQHEEFLSTLQSK